MYLLCLQKCYIRCNLFVKCDILCEIFCKQISYRISKFRIERIKFYFVLHYKAGNREQIIEHFTNFIFIISKCKVSLLLNEYYSTTLQLITFIIRYILYKFIRITPNFTTMTRCERSHWELHNDFTISRQKFINVAVQKLREWVCNSLLNI